MTTSSQMATIARWRNEPPYSDQPQDVADARAIDRRANEMAAEAMDRGDDVARNWLADEGVPQEWHSVILGLYASIATESDTLWYELERAALRNREKYIKDCAPLYRAAAEREHQSDLAAMGSDE